MANFERSSPGALAIESDQPECFRCDKHTAELLKRLQDRRDLSDVVLIAGASGKRIFAHRVILMASSDFFSDLLSEPKDEFKLWEVTLDDVDGDALEKLVNFCYTGSLELRLDTIKIMLITANYLQLKEITEGCSEFFLRHLQPSNCLTVASMAEELNLEEPLHNIKKFIYSHFEEVSKQPEFLLLNAKQLSELIASNDLDVPSEEFVFHILMKWIEYEPEYRRKHFTELLAQVRLPLLPPAFLTEKVEPLCTTMESKILILDALKSRLLLTSNIIQPRNSSSKVNKLWAICAQTKTNLKIAEYDLRTKVWNTRNTLIGFRSGFTVALIGEDLIVVGGSSNDTPINTVKKLNIHTMVSSEMASLRTSRTDHAGAVLNGSIYTIGGYNGHQDLNSVERYDPLNRTWNFVALMNTPRQDPAVAVINGRLYVSGGKSGKFILNSMECYDPVENTWRSTAPMKVHRYSHCLAAHKGYLFAIGGCGYACIPIERYDPRIDTWTTISCSANISGYSRCVLLGTELFINNFNTRYPTIHNTLYTIRFEDNCDNLKLQILPTPSDTFIGTSCKALVAIP